MNYAGRYENLSPKEYLNVIRPYLRDLMDEHKPIMELNNNNNNNKNNNKKNMHREIRAFSQHVYGIMATIGHSCNVLGYFRNI